jgi:hypothetical protein
MKHLNKIVLFAVLILLVFSLNACKKDAISVKTEKAYYERVVLQPGDWYTGMGLRLQPNGKATLIEGGDMASEGHYKIQGNKLTLRIEGFKPRKFTIISEQEIHAETGEKLFFSDGN